MELLPQLLDFKSYLSSLHSASARRLVTITIIVTNTNIKTSSATFVTKNFTNDATRNGCKITTKHTFGHLSVRWYQNIRRYGQDTYHIRKNYIKSCYKMLLKLLLNKPMAKSIYIYSGINSLTKSTNSMMDLQKRLNIFAPYSDGIQII